jgi:prepilin-type N-terminal cleavage/methylation domain-containing protein
MKKAMGLRIRGGFTLIELLVVISIVSLLSSVVLASLNGARKKADDTQRNQIVGEYVKALALAYDKAGVGSYPYTGDTGYWCLGDYTPTGASNHGTNNVCRRNAAGVKYSENSTVLDAVAVYLTSLPTLKLVTYSGTSAYDGPFYRCPNAGNCTTAEIEWYLDQASQKCIKGATPSPQGTGTKCVLTLN